MKKQNASIDSSFWIDIYRVRLVEEALSFFKIYAADDVTKEILKPLRGGFKSDDAELFEKYLKQKRIYTKNPKLTINVFGKGEGSAISLAKEINAVILIDDYKPYEYAKDKLKLKPISSLDFTISLFQKNKIDKQKFTQIINRLPGISQKEKENLQEKLNKGGVKND